MKWRKRIRINADGVRVAADVNAAVSVNRGEPGSATRTESVSQVQVVQNSRREAASAQAQPESEQKEKK
jgi:hypothetical protein